MSSVYCINRISCNRSDKPKSSNGSKVYWTHISPPSESGDNVFSVDNIKDSSNEEHKGLNIA